MGGIIPFFLGLIVGSFLNVVIHRLPRGESLFVPRSHCPQCKGRIAWWDNIPLLSYLILKGRCRKCRTPVSVRYPLVEFLGGVSFWGAYRLWGFSFPMLAGAFLFFSLIAVAFIDLEHRIIPDEINFLGIGAGMAFSVFYPSWHGVATRSAGFFSALAGLLLGGGVLLLLGWIGDRLFKKESMGGGDVKFLAFLGSFLGWKGVLLTLFIGSLIGAMTGLFLKLFRGVERIPFGPYLALGAIIDLVAGNKIVLWYMHRVLQL